MSGADNQKTADVGERDDIEEHDQEPDHDNSGEGEGAGAEAEAAASQAAKGHAPRTPNPAPDISTGSASIFSGPDTGESTRLVHHQHLVPPPPPTHPSSFSESVNTAAAAIHSPSSASSLSFYSTSPPPLQLSLTSSSLSTLDSAPYPGGTSRLRANSHSQSLILPPPSPSYKFFRKRRSASVSDFIHVIRGRPTTSPPGLRAERFWTPLHTILPSLPSPAPSSPLYSPSPSLSSAVFSLPPAMSSANNTSLQEPQAAAGPDVVEIQTQVLGFLAIAGETKIRLLPEQWPADSLPQPTSSLLAIASRSDLLAAAAPNGLVIGTTSAIRDAFSSQAPANNNIKPFSPQLTIQTPRISQVAFSSDESCLIISAEQGGGLAVYQVDTIKQGSTEAAFQIGTNGVGVRALLPNPAPNTAHLIALVLAGGQLMIADLQNRALANPGNSPVLKDGVSCVSWSAKGKQLVAGLGDGTSVQMDPSGTIVAKIPRPPQLQGDQHVSGISWLDNDHFLIIFTPSNFDLGHAPDSTFFYVSREKGTSNFMFQKLQESPCGPFGMNRSPPHHFVSRLRSFPPSLDDTLIISSTASGDIGLITCSKTSLSPENSNSANTYTTTSISDDARKAQLPPSDEMVDTSPLGMAIDLSSKSTVPRPLPMDEIESSPTPLPNLMVLNNEGLLCSWWFVYADSIKQGKGFPGLVAIAGDSQTQLQTPTQPVSGFGSLGQSQTAWGSTGAGSTATSSPFAQRAPAFGSTSAPGIGTGNSFGSSSTLGASNSPWATSMAQNSASHTGSSGATQPVFGSATTMGSGAGFGAVGGLGNRASPWATSSQSQPTPDNKPASPFSSSSTTSGFASIGQQSSNGANNKVFGSSFANASTTSGFAALNQPSTSIFGAPTTSPPALASQESFPSTVTIGSNLSSSFGRNSTLGEPRSAWQTPALSQNPSDAFSAGGNVPQETEMTSGDMDMETQRPSEQEAKISQDQSSRNIFGDTSSPFKLQSQFARDEKDEDAAAPSSGKSLFGTSFSTALKDTEHPTQSKQQEKTLDQNQSHNFGLFSDKSTVVNQTDRDRESHAARSVEPSKTTDDQDRADSLSESPVFVKPEPEEEIESAPLPPDPGSLTSSSPQLAEEPPAPLPPDPTTKSATGTFQDALPPAPLPPDSISSPVSKAELDEEQSAPLPPDPVLQTPAKSDSQEKNQSPLPSDAVAGTPARFHATENISPKQTSLPVSETPLQSNRRVQTPSTTPLAPRPVNQSPTRQPQTPIAVSTTPTAPPPSRQTPGVQSISKTVFPSSRLSLVEESPARYEPKANIGQRTEEVYDDSDIQIRKELESDINPTKTLAPFLAHQDYVGRVPGQGIEAQIEKVYRDINSMIDTLGLNARSLKAFLEGHDDFQDGGMSRDSLESRKINDWNLGEIVDLQNIENEIEESLDEQRLRNVSMTVTELLIMQKNLEKLRSRNLGLRKLLHANQSNDPSAAGSTDGWDDARKALSVEQSLLLTDLRKQFAEIQKSIAETEDSITLLRAKAAGVQSTVGASSRKLPTFEGVINTISKMTRMVEQRSGDVDLLESQIRRLQKRSNRGSLEISGDLDDVFGKMNLNASLMSSRGLLATPPNSRGNGKSNGTRQGSYQFNYDSQSDDERYESPLRQSVRSSSSKEKPANAKQISVSEAEAFNARIQRRAQVLGLLKKEVCKRGTLVQGP